jgi:peptidoglycan biosynthesis protein MviN/MurJ (putative lipid II flippase)
MIYLISFISPFISLFNFLIQILLVRSFGLGEKLDIYFLTLSIPFFLYQIVHAGFTFGIMPILSNDKTKENNFYIYQMFLILCFLIAFLYFLASFFITYQINFYKIFNDLDLEEFKFSFALAWIYGAFAIILASLGTLYISEKKYILGVLLPFAPQFGLFLALILFGKNLDVSHLIFSSIIGSFFGILFFSKSILIYLKSLFHLEFSKISLKPFFNAMLYAGVGSSIFGSYVFIDSLLGPAFGTGVLTSLGYSQRIIIGFGGIAILGLFTVAVPELKEKLYEGAWIGFYNHLKKLLTKAFIFSVILSLFMYLFIDIFIDVFFISEKFSQSNALILAGLIKYMLPGMTAMLLANICLKALFCMDKIKTITVFIGIFWPVSYIFFINYFKNFGAFSFGISYSISWISLTTMICLYLLIRVKKEIKQNNYFQRK